MIMTGLFLMDSVSEAIKNCSKHISASATLHPINYITFLAHVSRASTSGLFSNSNLTLIVI